MKKLIIITLLINFSLIGCISIRSGEYVGTPNSDFNFVKKQNIKIDFMYEYLVDGSKEPMNNPTLINAWTSFGEETLKEIPNVSITKEDTIADYIFEVKVQEKTSTLSTTILPIISGLTLTILPSYISAENHMETTVKNKKGQKLATITKKENYSLIVQLFLIVTLPFTDFVEDANQQKKDMFKATYKELQDLKLLTATPKK
ncbi:MAG: hypothetical protein O9346_08915 [Leptospiraceae bacterium]|nr:hypothetical protein [Leptospiraceae bacterium]MCZ8346523.1 hypothetical protein [Leptospiraceae bacterium]